VGVILLTLAAWFGGELVYRHRICVQDGYSDELKGQRFDVPSSGKSGR
jgi:hypothetical protein